MKYYAIYEITGIRSKKLIGYVAPEQSSLDKLADNAEGVPAISPGVAAEKLGRMLAENRPWTVMEDDKKLVGASFGFGSRHDEFYNNSCIDNYAILKSQSEKLSKTVKKLSKPVNPKPEGKPSRSAKIAGFDSLNELSEITGESVQTLNNWYKNNPRRFALIVKGAQTEKLV